MRIVHKKAANQIVALDSTTADSYEVAFHMSRESEEDGRARTECNASKIPNSPRELRLDGEEIASITSPGLRSCTHHFKESTRLPAGEWGTQHSVCARKRGGEMEWRRRFGWKEQLVSQARPWASVLRIRPCSVHLKPQNFPRFSVTSNLAVHA
jgi:hypothetical protein